MGCNECGLVYSLVFRTQFHKVDCTVGLKEDRSLAHSDLNTIDLDHDLGTKDLTDPFDARGL